MRSITEFTEINRGIEESHDLQTVLGLTVASLESLLEKPEYKISDVISIKGKQNKKAELALEKVTGFGIEMANVFETLSMQLGRIPSQSEFNKASLLLIEKFWKKETPEGIEWNQAVIDAASNRNRRTYLAQLNEFHCVLLIKELFPEWSIYTSNDLDLLLGVDIVLETDKKRFYLHLFKNSQYSFVAYRKKEKRGGRKDATGKFKKFRRDFSGDKTLMYEGRTNVMSATTKFINGVPLFQSDWLESQLTLFNDFKQYGEPLTETGKLQYLEDYLASLKSQEVTA